MKRLIGLLCCFLLLADSARGENEYVHPRVHELEEKLGKDTNLFLKGRFPDLPFLVTVKLDPVYRSERSYEALAKGERLPYFDTDSEEIKDEWDDPEKSLSELLRRVRKTVVTVSIPSSVSDSEMAEIKDSLFNLLHLSAARDEIVLQRKDWQTSHFDWRTGVFVAVSIFSLLVGLLLINRSSANRIAKAVAETKGAGGGATFVAPPPASSAPVHSERPRESLGGNVKVNDPLRLKDIVGRIVDGLIRNKAFPNRYDIFELDEFGKHDPAALGALLVEFPLEIRQKIFAFGSGNWWLDGLTHPGMLDFEALDVLQRLSRNPRDEGSLNWDHFVLSVWRLNERCPNFIRTLSRDEGFAILHAMPKAAALACARKAFPGNWASILRSDSKPQPPSEDRIRDLMQKAQQERALNQMSLLESYRQEIELLVHLKSSDPYEEKEIYDALPEDSHIRKTRPAFFKLFEQTEAVLKRLLPSLTTEQWAMVLLDVRPQERLRVENLFNDKQKFMYAEKQKTFLVQSFSDPERVGELREQVARRIPVVVLEIANREKAAKDDAAKFERTMKKRKGEIDEEEPKPPTEIRNAA